MRKNGKNIECPICKLEFYVKKSQLKRRKYCSLKCRNKGYLGRESLKKNPTIECKWCGKKVNNPWRSRKFCSILCYAKSLKGRKPWNYLDGRSKLLSPARYGCDWDKIRYLILRRDKFICQDCGIKKRKLDIHHKIPFLISFDNSINNLITLCRKCHMKEEARIIRKLKEGRELICHQR